MKGYPEYKDSGIEWLGRIPKHWNTDKFCRVSYMKGRIGWQGLKQSEFVDDLSLPYLITGMNFKNGVINWEEVYHITEERYAEAPEIQLQNDDVLMTKDGTIGKLLYVDHLPNKTSLNSHLLVLRPLDKKFVPRFIYYELQSEHFKNHVEQVKTGTTFYGITQEGTGQFKVLLPPIIEQSQIATFLDNKSRQIDNLIAKKQKLIELLQEERTALINQVVTKGLDPTVPMKDSGIEWLGEIPANWEVTKLKYKAKIINGSTPDTGNAEYWDGNIKWVTPSDISKSNTIEISDSIRKITELGLANCGTNLIPQNSIILTTRAPIGNLAINSLELCTNQGCKAIVPLNGNPYFYYYQILNFSDVLVSLGSGTTFKELSTPALSDFMVATPPIPEQSEIASFLSRKNDEISGTIKFEERQIEHLIEYKTSLINEAVTGKIDIGDYQINHA